MGLCSREPRRFCQWHLENCSSMSIKYSKSGIKENNTSKRNFCTNFIPFVSSITGSSTDALVYLLCLLERTKHRWKSVHIQTNSKCTGIRIRGYEGTRSPCLIGGNNRETGLWFGGNFAHPLRYYLQLICMHACMLFLWVLTVSSCHQESQMQLSGSFISYGKDISQPWSKC